MTAVPRSDIENVIRLMARHYRLDEDEVVNLVTNMTAFERQFYGLVHRGVMAVPIEYAKQLKLGDKYLKDWRENIGAGFKILDHLTRHHKGNLKLAISDYRRGKAVLVG